MRSADGSSGVQRPAPKPAPPASAPRTTASSSGYLRLGSRGTAVAALQRQLGIPADGIFGPQTLAAVKAFQSRHGLAADGVVGPQTHAALGTGAGSASPSGGSTATRTATTHTPQDWSTTAAGRAAMYGWSKAVIDSNPELKSIFAQASAGNWTVDRFIAQVRDTKWFKTHSDTARQAIILAKADPATYNQRLSQAAAQATSMAGQMGAVLDPAHLHQISAEAVLYGWTTDQLKQTMAKFITANRGGQFTGGAAAYQEQYNQLAGQYGINVSAPTMANLVRQSVMGTNSPEQVRNYFVTLASSKYPSLAARLKAGETLQQIAEPYMQSYAQTLEVNPNAIKLSDPIIQQALAYKDKTGQPVTKTVWQFEQDLRQDPRYMKTQQAQDSAMKMAHQVLSDWGVVS